MSSLWCLEISLNIMRWGELYLLLWMFMCFVICLKELSLVVYDKVVKKMMLN